MNLILSNKTARLMLVNKSHRAFFATYFSNYLAYPCAEIHQKLFDLTEDANNRFAVGQTFRGSGKSTIISLSYALWAVLGCQQKHLVVLVAKTQDQAKKLLDGIKRELETNRLLQSDFGKIHEESTPWNSTALTFNDQNAQITAISIDQAMRGMRFKNYRPDLIILDDIEDSASVRTLESRDRLQEWFDKDLLPAGDTNTRVILLGNNLHPDSLPNRIIDRVQNGQFNAKVIRCPLVDENGVCAWPGKFPTKESLEAYRKSFSSERTWRQEFLLQPVLSEETIVNERQIQYYDEFPEDKDSVYAAIGIDLACSTSARADKTSMVSARIYGKGDEMRIYFLPNAVNERLEIHGSIKKCVDLAGRISLYGGTGRSSVRIFVESVGFQKTFAQQLTSHGMKRVEEFQPGKIGDKRDRLYMAADLIKSGQILFPRHGLEELIGQIVAFGVERYDDLVDAFTTLVLKVIENNPRNSSFGIMVGDLNKIYTPEELAIERENQRRDYRTMMDGYDYQVMLAELHAKGQCPNLRVGNPFVAKRKKVSNPEKLPATASGKSLPSQTCPGHNTPACPSATESSARKEVQGS